MAHIHSVYDTDKHFTIDPATRALVNQTPEKARVMQYDHNSERITFDLPAVVEGHRILDCNRVEVHYLNIDAKTEEQRSGLYEVDDLQLSPADQEVAICSWLISMNATQLVGPLYFRVTFKCVTEGNIDYSWSTAIYKGLTISDGINCTEYVADQYADIIAQWREDLNTVTNDARAVLEEVKETAVRSEDNANEAALDFADESGNVVLRVTKDGQLETKLFKSEQFKEELDLSRCDFGKEMPTDINYYVEGDVIVCKCSVTALAGSMLKLFTAVGSGVARGSASFVNFETGVMGMYGGIASLTDTLTTKYSKKIGFALVAGHEYVVEMMKKGKEHTIKITDAFTLESDSLSVTPNGSDDIGEHWGKRSYRRSGSVFVDSFRNYSLQPYECRLLILGDSFVEGNVRNEKGEIVFTANHANRYCTRMKRLLNGSCAINGFGGATTEQVLHFYNSYCKRIFKPEYVLIACGTNNTDYDTWLAAQQELILSIENSGAIPILVTITHKRVDENLAFIKKANEWIREGLKRYIDVNRITTVNGDGVTQNLALFEADQVHPTPEAHELITKRALLDVPEVFNLSSSYVQNRNDAGGLN